MANTTAEKILLSGLCQHTDKFFLYCEYLSDEDFCHSATRMTFEALKSLVIEKQSTKITKTKLVSEAKSLGHHNYLSVTKEGAWLDGLFNEEVSEGETDTHFLEVKKETLKNQYILSFKEQEKYLNATDDPLSKIISNVESSIVNNVNILDRGEHAIVDMREGFQEFIDSLGDDPGHVGLDLGYPIWQERIGQIRNGTMTFFVGTTGSGKSQFGAKAAVIAARKGLPVLYLDSELNKQDQWIRIAAMIAHIPSDIIETGLWKLSENEIIKHGIKDPARINLILDCGRRLRDKKLWELIDTMPFYYQSISGLSVPDVIPHMRRWLMTHVKPDKETKAAQCLIVYDYIKLAMTTEISRGVLQEWQQHGLHVGALHDFLTKHNVPMIAFGQTNNEAIEGIKCIAGGKRISENVESVSFFKRKTDTERASDPEGTHMMKIFKSRYGKGLYDSWINFDADLSCGDFKELDIGSVNTNNNNDDDNDDE